MKLCATIQSERGKTIQKTGNEYMKIILSDEQGDELVTLHVTVAYSHLQGKHYNVYINNPKALYLDIINP